MSEAVYDQRIAHYELTRFFPPVGMRDGLEKMRLFRIWRIGTMAADFRMWMGGPQRPSPFFGRFPRAFARLTNRTVEA